MMDEPKPFWRVDLSKLTLAGWLLMAAAILSFIAAAVGLMLLLEALGLRRNPQNAGEKPWYEKAAFAAALGVGFAVFEIGRRLLRRWGKCVMRDQLSSLK